jgi:aspartate aminotransferase
LGALAFPDALSWLANALAITASETFTSTSAPIQHAAVCAFEHHPELEDYLQRARKILSLLGKHSNAILNSKVIYFRILAATGIN